MDNLSIDDNRLVYKISDSIVREFHWDLKSAHVYQTALNVLQSNKFDYRYYLIFANLKSSEWSDEGRLIGTYYKYKFTEFAIDQGVNITKSQKDTLKLQLAYTYTFPHYLSNGGFLSYDDFKNYAKKLYTYTTDLLIFPEKYSKKKLSMLYYIRASIIYDVFYKNEKDSVRLNDVMRNFKLAIDNDPENRLAYRERANIKFDEIKDYSGAAQDFKKEYNIRLKNNTLTNNLYMQCYPILAKIGDCYYFQENYSNALIWYNKAITEINTETKKTKYWGNYTINEMKNDIGQFYYNIALCYHFLKQNNFACNELRKAIEVGYNVQKTSEIFKEFNCK